MRLMWFYFINYADGNFVQDIVGNTGPVGGHEVGGFDCLKTGIVVGTEVPHYANEIRLSVMTAKY